MPYETRWTRPLNLLADDLPLWLWRCRLLHHLHYRLAVEQGQ